VPRIDPDSLEDLEERLVDLNRVAKVHKGGRRFSFSALVVVGNGKGIVGAGVGKAAGVPEAIRKGGEAAKKSLFEVAMVGRTIPHEVVGRTGATRVMLRPAAPGTGVIAGGPVRAVVEAAGIKDILTKRLGAKSKINAIRATVDGLQRLFRAEQVAQDRGKSGDELPIPRYFRLEEELLTHEQPVADLVDQEPDRLQRAPQENAQSPGTDQTEPDGDKARQPVGPGDGESRPASGDGGSDELTATPVEEHASEVG